MIVNGKTPKAMTPEEKDQVSISGHMSNPDSDSDVSKNAQAVGLYDNSTNDQASPVGIGEEINHDEQQLHDNDNEDREPDIPTAREIADQVDANVHDPLDVLTGGNDPEEDDS